MDKERVAPLPGPPERVRQNSRKLTLSLNASPDIPWSQKLECLESAWSSYIQKKWQSFGTQLQETSKFAVHITQKWDLLDRQRSDILRKEEGYWDMEVNEPEIHEFFVSAKDILCRLEGCPIGDAAAEEVKFRDKVLKSIGLPEEKWDHVWPGPRICGDTSSQGLVKEDNEDRDIEDPSAERSGRNSPLFVGVRDDFPSRTPSPFREPSLEWKGKL